MPSEEIELVLKGDNSAFFNEMDRRIDSMADRFSRRIANASRTGGGGGASPGGGGAGLSAPTEGAGAFRQALESNLMPGGAGTSAMNVLQQGVQTGLAATPNGALGSEKSVAQNVGVGVVQSVVHNTVGKIPVIGDYANALADSWAEAIHEPTRRASQKAQAYYSQLAKYGIKTSDEEMAAVAKVMIQTEQRGFDTERRTQRIFEEAGVDHNRSLGYGISRLGI